MIALGSDHIGVELKGKVMSYLEEQGVPLEDCGCFTAERVNYPEFAEIVCRMIQQGRAEQGMLFCGTGVGMSIAANRMNGIRAVVCSDTYSARLSREHNDTNVLCLGARVVGWGLAQDIVEQWLRAEFAGGRHAIRVKMLDELGSRKGPTGAETRGPL